MESATPAMTRGARAARARPDPRRGALGRAQFCTYSPVRARLDRAEHRQGAPVTSWVCRTAAEIAAAVREKRTTPREVVAEHLARIEQLDGRVGAFRRVRTDAAPAEADEV